MATTPRSSETSFPSFASSSSSSERSFKSQSTKIGVLKNLRLFENRLCADCSIPLSNQQQNIFGSLEYGVWLCQDCANLHLKLFKSNLSKIKSTIDQWSDEEINHMIKLGSNIQINERLEKYIPLGWNKCTSTSTIAEKELWIRAKYESRLFSIPLSSSMLNSGLATKEQVGQLPIRLFDYFVTVSLGQCLENNVNLMESSSLENIQFSPEIKMCYPGENYYSDTTLPNLLGTFIYPSGISLYLEDQQPSFFTFILTDVNAIKLYGGVLHIYELIDADEIHNLTQSHEQQQDNNNHMNLNMNMKSKSSHIRHGYRPKALVLLSHYPFYNLFRLILIQLYRLSLSSCPLPFDHYLANIFEIPLPPYGETEILYHGLPGCPLLLYRPPRNQLPMIDYSFRPLFMSLSVENILLIFSYLLNEHKLCFCSHNLSILTPIQESFLSFIFPFVWQGAYIPIIPASMIIILDAPVPFIVGIDSSCLPSLGTTEYLPPEGLVMIDIDNDIVYIGNDMNGKKIESCELPSREVTKLKEILIRNGGCIYGPKRSTSLLQSCLPFPKNEHLIPLDIPPHGCGHLIHSTQKLNIYDTIVGSAETKVQVNYQCTISLLPKPPLTGSNDSQLTQNPSKKSPNPSSSSSASSTASALASPSATTPLSSKSNEKNTQAHVNLFTSSLLCPSNNCVPLSPPSTPNGSHNSHNVDDVFFDVKEIRYAFLRFFISVLRDYQQFLEENSKFSRQQSGYAGGGGAAGAGGGSKQNKSRSSNFHANSFLSQLSLTQMFSKFTEEREISPNQPEINFFAECIVDKLNRSKKMMTKSLTPFLDDTSFQIQNTFIPLTPIHPPLNSSQRQQPPYIYSTFPNITSSPSGVNTSPGQTSITYPRRVQPLYRHHETRRLTDISIHHTIHKTIQASGNDFSTTGGGASQGVTAHVINEYYEKILHDSKFRFENLNLKIIQIQNYFRMKKCWKKFQLQRHSCQVIQQAYQRYKTMKLLKIFSFKQLGMIIFIQKMIRKFLVQRNYQRKRRAILLIQRNYRNHFYKLIYDKAKSSLRRLFVMKRSKTIHANFRQLRKKIIKLQSCYRRWSVQRYYLTQFKELMRRYKQIFYHLWRIHSIPYEYRAKYWKFILHHPVNLQPSHQQRSPPPPQQSQQQHRQQQQWQHISYFTLSIQQKELNSFCLKYGYQNNPLVPPSSGAAAAPVPALASLPAPILAHGCCNFNGLIQQLSIFLQYLQNQPSHVTAAVEMLNKEKLALYLQLKNSLANINTTTNTSTNGSRSGAGSGGRGSGGLNPSSSSPSSAPPPPVALTEAIKDSYFSFYHLTSQKKRKFKLIHEMLWRSETDEECEMSTEIILKLINMSEEERRRWRRDILSERINFDMMEIVRDWMKKELKIK